MLCVDNNDDGAEKNSCFSMLVVEEDAGGNDF